MNDSRISFTGGHGLPWITLRAHTETSHLGPSFGSAAVSARVSVIIPAFRAESFIARSVGSVLKQSAQDFELVIGSDDEQDYLAILKMQGIIDPRIRCVFTGGAGRGAALARNAALGAARGRLVASLDADDEFLVGHLERMVPLAERHGAGITQVDFRDHDTGEPLPNRAKPQEDGLRPLEEILLGCLHTCSSIVFDREKVTHVWNEHLPVLEDPVFLAQCYNSLPAVWYVSQPSYRYHRRSDSLCNSANAAERFLNAGRIVLSLLDQGAIPASAYVARVLKAYIARNDSLQIAFDRAVEDGEATDYQDFMARNVQLLHAPLCS
jgi:succinoglycan biosynthesis protein ExoO